MKNFNFGYVPSLLMAFRDGKVDFSTLEKTIEFQIYHQAQGIAIPTHIGESVSITGVERKEIFQFTVKVSNGRIPVIANVSEAGTDLACDLAKEAYHAGVDAIYACVPYYWTPPESMLLEHFKRIGTNSDLPFFVYNSPEEMGGVKVSTSLVRSLVNELPQFSGIIDLSLDWQYMIEVISDAKRIRPEFQLITGTEYMISASAIGATGLLSPVANVAPKLVRELFDLCRNEKFQDAYDLQVDVAFLFRLFNQYGISGLKTISHFLGRDLGTPRMPLDQLDIDSVKNLLNEWQTCRRLQDEPNSWSS